MGGNGIGPDGAAAMAGALADNPSLTALHMDINAVGDDGARAVGLALESNTMLRTLCLKYNGLTMAGVAAVLEGALANPESALEGLVLGWDLDAVALAAKDKVPLEATLGQANSVVDGDGGGVGRLASLMSDDRFRLRRLVLGHTGVEDSPGRMEALALAVGEAAARGTLRTVEWAESLCDADTNRLIRGTLDAAWGR